MNVPKDIAPRKLNKPSDMYIQGDLKSRKRSAIQWTEDVFWFSLIYIQDSGYQLKLTTWEYIFSPGNPDLNNMHDSTLNGSGIPHKAHKNRPNGLRRRHKYL